MKKVRFESPIVHNLQSKMNDPECQSPRPFIGRELITNSLDSGYITTGPKVINYSNDPVKRFEHSNASPYSPALKTNLKDESPPVWCPSNDLELSLFDASEYDPRPGVRQVIMGSCATPSFQSDPITNKITTVNESQTTPANILTKDDGFFIRPNTNTLDKFSSAINPLQNHLRMLKFDKENNPLDKKQEMILASKVQPFDRVNVNTLQRVETDCCNCNHTAMRPTQKPLQNTCCLSVCRCRVQRCPCEDPPTEVNCCCESNKCHKPHTSYPLHNNTNDDSNFPKNPIDKKTWAINKYEESKNQPCMEIEQQKNIVKEKREPTVADLFKIIKLQNEQLQLLQEKVDKFISKNQQTPNNQQPTQKNVSEQVALPSIDTTKISIGVMTSFEMVRTSTVINKEVVQQTGDTQVQTNKSQISVTEVVTKGQPGNINVLDGIIPVSKTVQSVSEQNNSYKNYTDNCNEDKTVNELSLCNVQVDNAVTPLMSPDQTLYLDVKDYSDSDSSDEQSNVGWTYYNKVMTHVNGMLHDSDMPSSASAMYKNVQQHCRQMQLDKTNISVAKRVNFADDVVGIRQQYVYTATASTDTSMKMNQLAAKYLRQGPAMPVPMQVAPSTNAIDLSLATKNYFERHNLMHGMSYPASHSSATGEIPRFLDITALKRQPKFL